MRDSRAKRITEESQSPHCIQGENVFPYSLDHSELSFSVPVAQNILNNILNDKTLPVYHPHCKCSGY